MKNNKYKSNEDFAYHIRNYLSIYLPRYKGLGENTIISYRDTFVLLMKYFKEIKKISPEKITLEHLTKELIKSFLDWLEQTRGSMISTRNHRLSVIHAFFRYLQLEEPENIYLSQQIIAIKLKKQPKPIINYLTLEGLRAILAQPDTLDKRGYRDLVLLATFYDTGARVSEIADLTVGDIRLTEPATVKLTGKGKKSRLVPLLSKTTKYLKKYLKINKLDLPASKDCPVFFNRKKEKLTRAGISYILNKYGNMVREKFPDIIPPKVSPHCLRHSKAVHLLQSGINLVYIRDLLGHSSIKVTEVYARADEDIKRKALEKASKDVSPNKKPVWQNDNNLMSWLQNLCKT